MCMSETELTESDYRTIHCKNNNLYVIMCMSVTENQTMEQFTVKNNLYVIMCMSVTKDIAN